MKVNHSFWKNFGFLWSPEGEIRKVERHADWILAEHYVWPTCNHLSNRTNWNPKKKIQSRIVLLYNTDVLRKSNWIKHIFLWLQCWAFQEELRGIFRTGNPIFRTVFPSFPSHRGRNPSTVALHFRGITMFFLPWAIFSPRDRSSIFQFYFQPPPSH